MDIKENILSYCRKHVKDNPDKDEFGSHSSKFKESDKLQFQLFNDPIHGSIQLNCLERAIINTPEFYRLKNIKQLGGACHVYPGATHTRFEHSLGVCYIAGQFVEHLNRKHPNVINEKDEYCIRLAALCHDLGHGPFSHAFTDVAEKMLEEDDDEFKDKKVLKHEVLSKLIFKKILLDHPVVLKTFVGFGLEEDDVKKVEKMIDPPKENKGKFAFIYEIVANKSSGVDVDKWDYFARDCHYLGMTNEFNWRRCMELSSIVEHIVVLDDGSICINQHIGFRDKQLNNILGMFRTRCDLYQRAYQHQAVNGIEMIFKEALVEARKVPLIDAHKSMKDAVTEGCIIKKGKSDLSGYIRLNDNILDHILLSGVSEMEKEKERKKELEELEEAQELINRVIKRDLYSLVHEEFFPLENGPNKKIKEDLEKIITKFNENPMEQLKVEGDLKPEHIKDLEIDLVTMKMASEGKDNPIEDIYFFTKGDEEEARKANMREGKKGNYPRGEKIAKEKSEISKLNLPQAFVEYRVRLYSKIKKKDKVNWEEIKKQLAKLFVKWIGEFKKQTSHV